MIFTVFSKVNILEIWTESNKKKRYKVNVLKAGDDPQKGDCVKVCKAHDMLEHF